MSRYWAIADASVLLELPASSFILGTHGRNTVPGL